MESNNFNNEPLFGEENVQPAVEQHPNFIESNTAEISYDDILHKCIVPTFSDNTLTISHPEFIQVVGKAAEKIFGNLEPVEIRVSHPISGRTPDALHKKQDELTDEDKTLFYQRMCFVNHVSNLTRTINGSEVHLTIGGARAYNEDRLYSTNKIQRFRIFVGWQVRVCSNLCLTCSGLTGTIECLNADDIYKQALALFNQFNPIKDVVLHDLESLGETKVTEQQFAKILGRLRLYQFIPSSDVKTMGLPIITMGDQAVTQAAKNYMCNPNFGKKEDEDITCWQLLNIFNEACKNAYIDRFLERNQEATDLAFGIQKSIQGEGSQYDWFLN